MTRHRLHWFSVRDHMRRKPWSLVFVDALENGNWGLTCPKQREVRILASLTYRQILETLSHELVHVFCDHANEKQTERDRADEEYVAGLAEPSLLPMLISMGATIPPLPPGLVAMRRRLRKAA